MKRSGQRALLGRLRCKSRGERITTFLEARDRGCEPLQGGSGRLGEVGQPHDGNAGLTDPRVQGGAPVRECRPASPECPIVATDLLPGEIAAVP